MTYGLLVGCVMGFCLHVMFMVVASFSWCAKFFTRT